MKLLMLVGMVGVKVMVDLYNLFMVSEVIDFVCCEEFDFICKEFVEGKLFVEIKGLSWCVKDGLIEYNEVCLIFENMDELLFVVFVYKCDLKIDNYFIGYLNYLYVLIYMGCGCKLCCMFCLWL